MTENQTKRMIAKVLESFVKWWNAHIESGTPLRSGMMEMHFQMYCERNFKKEVEAVGYDLLLRNLKRCITFMPNKC
jgi:hypothetical protein